MRDAEVAQYPSPSRSVTAKRGGGGRGSLCELDEVLPDARPEIPDATAGGRQPRERRVQPRRTWLALEFASAWRNEIIRSHG